MEKGLKDFQLIELLDIKSLLPDYSDKSDEDKEAKEVRNKAIAKIYDAIAKKLFNEYHIKKGDSTYDFLEIEFYYFDDKHPDVITYERNLSKGQWFFHDSGLDISFESFCPKDETEKSNNQNVYYGGILIRSLIRNDKKIFTGPQKCTWELFDTFNAFDPCPTRFPIIEKKSADQQVDIYKTKRWINIKDDRAIVRFDGLYDSYKENLHKDYRYYIKHTIWNNIKSSEYNARPWNKEEGVKVS